MTNKTMIAKAVKAALFSGAAATLAISAPASMAAEDGADEAERIVVTGSRIRQTDVEGATPVTTITREDLELSGLESVSDVLRSTTFNSFGSFRERSGTSFGQIALVSLRALGADRTAVLIDGLRVPGNPFTGSAAVDLNSIPLAAVESIDILTDGASAIYGADAIGGVINIKLRNDYEGAEFKFGAARPSLEGGDEENASFVIGGASDKANIVFSAEIFRRDAIFDADRDYSGVQVLNPGGVFGADTRGISVGGNTGFSTDFSEAFVLGDCQTTDDGGLYAGVFTDPFGVPGEGCGYGYADISAQTGAVDRFSTFLNASYQISDNHTLSYRNTYSRIESFGRYAPAVGFFFCAGCDPRPATAGGDILAFHRFVGHGTRDDNTTRYELNNVVTLEGFLNDDVEYSVYARNYRYEGLELGSTYVLTSVLEEEVAAGNYDVLNPLSQDPTHLQAVANSSATLSRDIITTYNAMGFSLNGAFGELAGGDIGWAFGGEWATEKYQDVYDTFREAGNVTGSAGNSAAGDRERYAVYGEMQFPITDMLTVNVAGRYDDYSDFGDEFSPQVMVRFQPLDNLVLRASWGEGFKAPNLTELYSSRAQSFNDVVDLTLCADRGIAAVDCPNNQVENFTGGNPDLQAETAETFNVGAVWEPIENLNVGVDFYNIEIENAVQQIGMQTIINLESQGNPLPPGVVITRDPPPAGFTVGRLNNIERGFANVGIFEVEGYDVKLGYRFDTDSFGSLDAQLTWSHINEYNFTSDPTAAAVNQIDSEGAPEDRYNLNLRWNSDAHTVNLISRYIADFEGSGGPDVPRYDDYFATDATYVFNTSWDADITVGFRNLFDADVPIDPTTGWDQSVSGQLYQLEGRTPFISYTQRL